MARGGIFISYRRQETAYAAGWLFDRLAEHFGRSRVFKDVHSIELGDDFVEVITEAVASCNVLLVLIGDQWLHSPDVDGKPRLHDPNDFVRLEIEAALARDVRVVPILVEGAKMPTAEELPESMAKLARRHALELSPARFESDTARLLKVLEARLDKDHADAPTPSPSRPTAPTAPTPVVPVDPPPWPPPPGRPPGPLRPAPPPPGPSRPSTRAWLLGGAAVVTTLVVLVGVVVAISGGGRRPDCGHELIDHCFDLGDGVRFGPALAEDGGQLLLAFSSNDEPRSALRVLRSGEDGTGDTDSFDVMSQGERDFTVATPAIATRDGRAYLAWTGADPDGTLSVQVADLRSSTSGGRPFVDRKTILPGRTTDVAPALVWHQDRLVLAWKAKDGQVFVVTSQDGSRFGNPVAVAGVRSRAAPSLASHGGRLFLAHVDPDGTARIGSLSERMTLLAAVAPNVPKLAGLSLASGDGRLTMAWLSSDRRIGLSSSADGGSFSEQMSMEAETDTAPSVTSLGGALVVGWTVSEGERTVRLAVLS